MKHDKFKTSNEDEYDYIRFTYKSGGTMTVNKPTYLHVYPDEKGLAEGFEYLKKVV